MITLHQEKTPVRRFEPDQIFPKSGVRINGTALRDWQQSVCSGRESTQHMSLVAPQLEKYHETLRDNFPGAEEVGGGTVPRMDISVRKEDPFDHVAKMKELLPGTPLMALIRSDAGAGMEETSQDVLEGYLLRYHKAGIDVFRNFHALNDPRAFVRVAKALHKTKEQNGTQAHFQAAYSYATEGLEPGFEFTTEGKPIDHTIDTGVYNPKTPVTFFKKLVAVLREAAQHDGLPQDSYLPHSLVIKDPSGVLTPEKARMITYYVKEAMKSGELPDLPFGIHTHNQMGHAAETCKAAAEAGANFVDCAPTPGGLGAQPPMPAMVDALGGKDGAAIGFANQAAFENAKQQLQIVDHLSEAILKHHDPAVRQTKPDPTVPDHCIAGGQASVARAEVKATLLKGKPAGTEISAETIDQFMKKVKDMMPQVRKELGMPCLVTPVADYIFREATRRAGGGDPNKGFYCGYRRIMNGEMGPTKEPVDPVKQKQALLERVIHRLPQSMGDNKIMHDFVQKSGALTEIRDVMLEYSKPVRDQQRFEELNERIAELQGSSHDLKAITRERDALAEGVDARKEAVARYNTFLKARTDDIVKKSGAGVANDPAVSLYHEIINKCDGLRKLRDGEEGMALAEQDCIRLIKSAAYTSLPISEILPANGMERARDKLRKLAEQGKYRIPDDQERFDKDAVLGSMLRDPYQPDPDKMVGDYFAARDGIAPSAPGALPRIQQRPSMAHLEMGVTFKQPVSTQQLRAQVLAPFIEAQRWDDATRLQVLPAESGALQSQRFTVSTTDMGSEEAIGVSAIVRSVVQSLQGTIGNARRDAGVTAAAV